MKRKKGEDEILTNVKRIEDRIWYGDTFKGEFEMGESTKRTQGKDRKRN